MVASLFRRRRASGRQANGIAFSGQHAEPRLCPVGRARAPGSTTLGGNRRHRVDQSSALSADGRRCAPRRCSVGKRATEIDTGHGFEQFAGHG